MCCETDARTAQVKYKVDFGLGISIEFPTNNNSNVGKSLNNILSYKDYIHDID